MLTKDQIELLKRVVFKLGEEADYQLNNTPFIHNEQGEEEWETILSEVNDAVALLNSLKPIEMLTWLESFWLKNALELYHKSTLDIQDKLLLPCMGEAFETFKKKLEQLVPTEHQDVSD